MSCHTTKIVIGHYRSVTLFCRRHAIGRHSDCNVPERPLRNQTPPQPTFMGMNVEQGAGIQETLGELGRDKFG
jgi:hypothetical protein